MVEAFEGNKAETATVLPVINAFKAAHQLTDVTVVADAGMISEANQTAIDAAGLSLILGTRIPQVPQVVHEWRAKHPGRDIPDGHVFTQPWPATAAEKARGIPDGSSTTSTATTEPGAHYGASTSRSPRPRMRWPARPGQTQPLHQTHRRHQVGQPRSGGQSPWPGRAEGLLSSTLGCQTPVGAGVVRRDHPRGDCCYSQDNLTEQGRRRRWSDDLSVGGAVVVAADGFEEVACGVDGGVGAVGVGQVESVPGPGDFEVCDRRTRN